MKVPVSWLKRYIDYSQNTNELCRALTMSGSKVEAVDRLCEEITSVVVGQVVDINKHPNADKLLLTKVDIGSSVLQIVTGAQNLSIGDYVPVATDGSILFGGKRIKKGAIRGEISEGMLCGIDELGYTRQDYPEAPENGIYVFPEPQKLGENVIPILMLRDDVIEFEITSNRADCFSVIGIARETAATLGSNLIYPDTTPKETACGKIGDYISVEIMNPDKCLRYCARVVKNVKIEPSPLWLRHCLTAVGIRPINNIVDITNFIMHEYGQPLHAFNIETIKDNRIIVRNAFNAEPFVTLDGQERILDNTMTVIADPEKPVAIGGIMGGENSKVTEEAAAILLESACFYGPGIRKTSNKLGLRTDSSTKFEKGLDPNLCEVAINRAAVLIETLGCGEVVPGIMDCYPEKREPCEVPFDAVYINNLLGTHIPEDEMIRILHSVEITVSGNNAQIPTYRSDIRIKADLAEEVARLYGYDNIELSQKSGKGTVGKKNKGQNVTDIIHSVMLYSGFSEMMNYSFESPKVFDKLNISTDSKERDAVKIINPLGEDYSIMRTTPLNGLLESLSTNYNRRNDYAALYEIGKVYSRGPDDSINEIQTLSVGAFDSSLDFFRIKGILENLFDILGLEDINYTKRRDIPYMHTGRCASVSAAGTEIGYFGEVHPAVCSAYEIDKRVYTAVMDIGALIERAKLERTYKPLPKYPGIKRDIAIIIDDSVPSSKVEAAIRERAGKNLESVMLFDAYTGEQIEKGCKSLAYSLLFRAEDKTLTEDEINTAINKILKNLEVKIGAKLR